MQKYGIALTASDIFMQDVLHYFHYIAPYLDYIIEMLEHDIVTPGYNTITLC